MHDNTKSNIEKFLYSKISKPTVFRKLKYFIFTFVFKLEIIRNESLNPKHMEHCT